MKKVSFLLGIFAFAASAIFSGCKKGEENNLTIAELIAGRCRISMNTNSSDFGNFSGGSVDSTGSFNYASYNQNAISGREQITLQDATMSGSGVNLKQRTATLNIILKAGSVKAGAGIAIQFEGGGLADNSAVLTIGGTNGGANIDGFTSKNGTLNITKISETEIEGNFSGTLESNANKAKLTTVSNGKFAAKFK